MVDREKRLNIRITDDEAEMLRSLAEREGLSASDIVRQYIRRAYAEAFPQRLKRK